MRSFSSSRRGSAIIGFLMCLVVIGLFIVFCMQTLQLTMQTYSVEQGVAEEHAKAVNAYEEAKADGRHSSREIDLLQKAITMTEERLIKIHQGRLVDSYSFSSAKDSDMQGRTIYFYKFGTGFEYSVSLPSKRLSAKTEGSLPPLIGSPK